MVGSRDEDCRVSIWTGVLISGKAVMASIGKDSRGLAGRGLAV